MRSIEDVVELFVRAENERDIELFASLLTDDVVNMLTDRPPAIGKQVVVDNEKGFFERFEVDLNALNIEIEESDGLAVVSGAMSMTLAPVGSEDLMNIQGKFINVLKRGAGGDWCISRMIVNYDHPVSK